MSHFYSFSCKVWITYNLIENMEIFYKGHLKLIFMISCWYLWKWNNKLMFEDGFSATGQSNNYTYASGEGYRE